MPWKIVKQDSGSEPYCVFKETADGTPTGNPLGCHATAGEAKKQLAALYVNVPEAKAVKFADGSETDIEGLLLPYGGVHNGADLYGERFTKSTEFCLDWSKGGDLPLLYHHGLDDGLETSAVGRIRKVEMRDDGGWMQAQLDASAKYFDQIKELVKTGKLFLSSGAMAHLVKVTKSGDITRWPLVEGSLTPTPANLLATVDFATATNHYKSAGLELPETVLPESIKALGLDEMKALVADLGMDMTPAEMQKMLDAFPDHDEAAMRKALATRKKMGKVAPAFADIVSFLLDDTGLDAESVPIGFHAEAAATMAASLVERTKDLRQRRIKEGRMISEVNRKRLMTCMEQMMAACTEMQSLLDSSMPPPKGTEGRSADIGMLRRLRAQLVAQQMSALALN